MNEFMRDSLFMSVVISLAAYEAGLWIRKKSNLVILNPLLTAILMIIGLLLFFHIDYETYNQGGRYLSYFLTPATICLAVPLYRHLSLLKHNFRAVIWGISSGVLANMVSVWLFSAILGLTHKEYVTLLPKSITTSVGMSISRELGGITPITVAAIIITGVFGNVISDLVMKVARIKEPVARGAALGTSAHAIGTVKAMEMGKTEGAVSSLAIVVSGLLTVFWSPVFSRLFLNF